MTGVMSRPSPARISPSLMTRIIETPDLARAVQVLPAPVFASMIHEVGIEDAGELIALATTEQLVQAFDETLFRNDRPGDREIFDASEFVTWLEVLLEAGDEAAARRFAELDYDFVAHALSSLVWVLDEDLLRMRMQRCEEADVQQVDKALESALTEDFDGYILVAKQHGDAGWDAALTLILALDRDHRPLTERLLDRLSAVARDAIDDLDQLTTVLNEAESLAEDVEAAREERRSTQGHVEPRAARAFLDLAKRPATELDQTGAARDPLTRAYFRDLDRNLVAKAGAGSDDSPTQAVGSPALALQAAWAASGLAAPALIPAERPGGSGVMGRLATALRHLAETAPSRADRITQELAYLANVLLAGADLDGRRMRPSEAAQAALATVCFGAVVEAVDRLGLAATAQVTEQQLVDVLRDRTADFLFRRASRILARVPGDDTANRGYLCSADDLTEALERGTR